MRLWSNNQRRPVIPLTNDAEEMTALVRQFDIGTGGTAKHCDQYKYANQFLRAWGITCSRATTKSGPNILPATQGSNALDLEMDSEEDNDWQDFYSNLALSYL